MMTLPKKLRHLGSAFLHNREVSAQEAAYRLLSIPMKQLSRSVVFLNTNVATERISVLKPLQHLEMMHDEDEDVFHKSMIDRYIHRPLELESMCFAEFGANYTVVYKEESQDSLPLMNEDATSTSRKIKLVDNFGTMHKRSIVRFHQPNKEKNPNDFFRTKLMLYLPWRKESTDLLCGYTDYISHYQHCQESQKMSVNIQPTWKISLTTFTSLMNPVHHNIYGQT